MLTHTLVNVRLNITDAWYVLPQDVTDRRQLGYVVPGKIMSRNEQEAPDYLSRTIVTTFSTLADYNEYINDPIIKPMFAIRDAYNTSHNITTSTEKVEL